MLNNPDIQPNAAINRWIAGILLFDFDLVHVPGNDHSSADRLSCRPPAEQDIPEPTDFEDWIDEAYSFSTQLMHDSCMDIPHISPTASPARLVGPMVPVFNLSDVEATLPHMERSDKWENELIAIQVFLEDPHKPLAMEEREF